MTRPYRPADGRFTLDMPVNDDFIPAGPSWRPGRSLIPGLHKEPDVRPRNVLSRFDAETGELVIDLQWSEPDLEKPAINDAIRFAKRQGILRRIVILVAQEVYSQTASFHFFKRNGFQRREDKGTGDFLWMEKAVKTPEETNGAGTASEIGQAEAHAEKPQESETADR